MLSGGNIGDETLVEAIRLYRDGVEQLSSSAA